MPTRGVGFEGASLWGLCESAYRQGVVQAVLDQAQQAIVSGRVRTRPPLGHELWSVAGEDLEAAAVRVTGAPAAAGNVAVINVFGLLTQHPTWWTTSTEELREAIAAAVAMPEIAAIVLRLNSPGGQVVGLPQLADFMRSAREKKPIYGHADSLAASCGYWVLASCTEAWASPLADTGSIGVFFEHMSFAGMDLKAGIKRTMIKFPEGKALAWDGEDLSEEAQEYLLAKVRTAYGAFAGAVAKGRGVAIEKVRSDEWGRGRTLEASAAAAVGMLNGVRTFGETVSAAARAGKARASATPRAEESGPAIQAEEPDADLRADLEQYGARAGA